MKLTDEQQAAVDLAAKGESFSLIAPAGSGKTAVAVAMLAELKNKKALYLVYNTQARKDAEEKFRRAGLDHVDVRTTSQFAWRAYSDWGILGKTVAEQYKARMKPGAASVPADHVARMLSLQPVDFGGGLALDGYQQAIQAADAIERFCNSDHATLTERDVYLPVAGVEPVVIDAARKYLARLSWAVWLRSIQPDSNLRFTMNQAFKLVVESGKDYGYEVVLLDEAQDGNNATHKFIQNQKGAQVIFCGDPAQALYEWRGASDQLLRHKGKKLFLTQSFRFGNAVAEEAMKHLPHTGTGVTIKGKSSIRDEVIDGGMEDPNVVLCRTNAGAMMYAMSYLQAGQRVALVRGTKQIMDLAFAARDLMAGRRTRNLELSAFKNWGELLAYTKEPGGGHLKSMVKLVSIYGPGGVIDACKQMTRYGDDHDVAVTTCHSVKGLEWTNVQLGDDFTEPEPFENPLTGRVEPGVIDRHEAMIHYVAVTRAQRRLDRGGLAWIDNYKVPDRT